MFFKVFLPFIAMAAMLVMCPRPFEQFSIPNFRETVFEIWLQSAQWFQRISRLKLGTDRHLTTTDDGACLYYKLSRNLRIRCGKTYLNCFLLSTCTYDSTCTVDITPIVISVRIPRISIAGEVLLCCGHVVFGKMTLLITEI